MNGLGRRPYEPSPESIPEHASTVTLAGRSSREWWEERLRQKLRPAHPKWDRILARCLHYDPASRYRSAAELAAALGPSRTRRWIAAAAAALVLAAASGFVAWQRATAPQETVRLALVPFRGETAVANRLRTDAANKIAGIASTPRTRFVFLPSS